MSTLLLDIDTLAQGATTQRGDYLVTRDTHLYFPMYVIWHCDTAKGSRRYLGQVQTSAEVNEIIQRHMKGGG